MNSRLKQLRRELKLNQADFSAKLEMAQNSYSQLETGAIALSEKNIKLICLMFGVNEQWLRTGVGEMLEHTELTHDEKRLLEVFEKLEPEGKKQVQEYADERLILQEAKKDMDRAWEKGVKLS